MRLSSEKPTSFTAELYSNYRCGFSLKYPICGKCYPIQEAIDLSSITQTKIKVFYKGKDNYMSQELGKVEKPEVSSFKHNRKILQVSLVYAGKDSPAEYMELFEKYWQQVDEMITKLENKLGNATVIYHETINAGGEEGLKMLETLNPKSHNIVDVRQKTGDKLKCIEDTELLEEVMDWERCLMIGFLSDKVAKTVYSSFSEASRKRYQQISKTIDETLKEGDIALLFIREGHMVQFPQDVDVFSVAPPALDEIHRWARDRAARREKGQDKDSDSSTS